MKIYITPNQPFSEPLRWVFELLSHWQQHPLAFVADPAVADCRVTAAADSDFPLALPFYEKYAQGVYCADFKTPSGATDGLARLFFTINDLETHHPTPEKCDAWGRFRLAAHSRSGLLDHRLADKLLTELVENHEKWRYLPTQKRRSALFLSHDIDSLYGSFIQDGLWALKKGRFGDLSRLVLRQLQGRPAWFNLADIQSLHTKRGLKSTFFWLVAQGRGAQGIKNADYDLSAPPLQAFWQQATAAGFEMGLHKTTHLLSVEAELARLPKPFVAANRYHFLKYQLPTAWHDLADAGVALEASFGFAEQAGFRNGYGLPFHPYDARKQSKSPLLVLPLHLMDGTLWHYMQLPKAEIASYVIDFLEKNKHNAVISLLWHNTEFADFQHEGCRAIYETILDYVVETEWPTLTASEVLTQYRY